jgi:ankyrin repeat protein
MPSDLAHYLYNPNLPDPELLCAAARKGDLKECRALLAKGALVNKVDGDGKPPIYCAAVYGHVDVCQLLVDSGADVRKRFAGGETALNFAIRGARPNALDVLRILYRADAFTPGEKTSWYSSHHAFFTPFQYAVKRGETEVVALLIDEFGEDPAQATVDGVAMVDLTTSPVTAQLLLAATAERSMRGAMSEPASEEPKVLSRTPNLGIL